jgi:hypothetical protein
MTDCFIIEEALDVIVSSIINTIGCDKAYCHVVDTSKGELWSKAFRLNIVKRSPMNEGLAGYVVSRKEIVNVLNASSDKRFSEELESRN